MLYHKEILKHIREGIAIKHIKIISILLVGMIAFTLISCDEQPASQQQNLFSGTGADIESAGFRYEHTLIDKEKKELKVRYDRQYGNGLYFEDFKETEARLTAEYQKLLEKECSQIIGGPVVMRCKLHIFTDTMKKAKDKNLTIQDLIKGRDQSFYQFADIEYMGFTAETDENKLYQIGTVLSQVDNKYYCAGQSWIFPKSVLKKYSVESIRKMENPIQVLEGISPCLYAYGWSSEYMKTTAQKLRNQLQKKYKELFEVGFDSYLNRRAFPLSNPELKFDATMVPTLSDMYLPVLQQKKMGDAIAQILKEENATDNIVWYVETERNLSNLIAPEANSNTVLDNQRRAGFLNKEYMWRADVLLLYLQTPGEDVDYVKLKRVSNKINHLRNGLSLSARFYELSPYLRNVVKDLFYKNPTPDTTFNLDQEHAIQTLVLRRTNSEGFRVLDIYGKIIDWYSPIIRNSDESVTVETFKTKYFQHYHY